VKNQRAPEPAEHSSARYSWHYDAHADPQIRSQFKRPETSSVCVLSWSKPENMPVCRWMTEKIRDEESGTASWKDRS